MNSFGSPNNGEGSSSQAGPSTSPARTAIAGDQQSGETAPSSPEQNQQPKLQAAETRASRKSSLSQGIPMDPMSAASTPPGPSRTQSSSHQVAPGSPHAAGKQRASQPSSGESSLRNGASSPPSPMFVGPGFSSSRGNNPGNSRLRKSVSSEPGLQARHHSREALKDIRSNIMINWLYEQQCQKRFISDGSPPSEGVVLKKNRGSFICCPPEPPEQRQCDSPNSLLSIVAQMNVRCAMTVNTGTVRALIETLAPERANTQGSVEAGGSSNDEKTPDNAHIGRSEAVAKKRHFVPLGGGLGIQVLPSLADLVRCQMHHFAAFIEETRTLVVWDDEPENLLERAQTLEASLIHLDLVYEDSEVATLDEKKDMALDPVDLEADPVDEKRPVKLTTSFMVMLSLAICLASSGLGWRRLALETTVDGDYTRLGLLATTPMSIFLSLFFFQALCGGFLQIAGPSSVTKKNNKYYSGKPPRRLDRLTHVLPHVTIQMPVYREGLDAVIRPTVMSLKAAISTYEMQGGSANIFVNDDGMQLVDEQEAAARQDFYDENNIGWVARPPHRPEPATGQHRFLRRGKFKKASNMNYALHVGNRVEEKLAAVTGRGPAWTDEHELSAYYSCLTEVLQEDDGRTWADGNIRMGDYILIIDSDTRVPRDCFLDAVSEMEQSPDVGVLQFNSGVMNVTKSYFERGVTWFTHLIYTVVTYAVASGDVAPFVGHNAILRWSAIQLAAPYTDEDGYEKYWSESHVSEDFDISLRLQIYGFTIRYAAYTGDGFKEGVSLTVYDELARWEKYAFGCNELLFHPLRLWPVRGPLTPLFRKFMMTGSIPLAKKCTTLAYIGTYYSIAAAWSLTLLNYFICGLYHDVYDKYYLDSFAMYVGIIIVFNGLGNVALAVLRHRTKEKNFMSSLMENLMWLPMFAVFLGGMSIHLSEAILCHFFEIEMIWGATAKEIENVHFGEEIWRVLRRFKWTFFFCFVAAALIVVGFYAVPIEWRITEFYAIYPLALLVSAHFALPVLLNPALMRFTW